ncbi:hypothetical protein TMEN_6771 [Trichophyton mentagrophytes]|uniref:Uncharacterized protein n=1 Tax=Streptomyces rochei TaxID=1928 RepID=A0A068Q6X1_STRRO|nr:hypothetical protein [Streptomyces rochei]BAP15805.1 hypothetical protein [Streptomyces rochei]GBF64099.1 hypothetical protein TMEN_6771 [Trichophyton mentagrophytes]
MAEPVIVTVHYTPPGAPRVDSLRLELHAERGAGLTLELRAHHPPTTAEDRPIRPGLVPSQTLTLRNIVHRLHALDVTDSDEIEQHAVAVLGRSVSRDSVERYLREAKAASAKGSAAPATPAEPSHDC